MADHGLTGTHHLDGSPCTKTDACPWSATKYMQALMARDNKGMTAQRDRAWNTVYKWEDGDVVEDFPPRERKIRKRGFEQTYGTTVLACECGIPWKKDHDFYRSILVCETHGMTTIIEYR